MGRIVATSLAIQIHRKATGMIGWKRCAISLDLIDLVLVRIGNDAAACALHSSIDSAPLTCCIPLRGTVGDRFSCCRPIRFQHHCRSTSIPTCLFVTAMSDATSNAFGPASSRRAAARLLRRQPGAPTEKAASDAGSGRIGPDSEPMRRRRQQRQMQRRRAERRISLWLLASGPPLRGSADAERERAVVTTHDHTRSCM